MDKALGRLQPLGRQFVRRGGGGGGGLGLASIRLSGDLVSQYAVKGDGGNVASPDADIGKGAVVKGGEGVHAPCRRKGLAKPCHETAKHRRRARPQIPCNGVVGIDRRTIAVREP